MNNRIVYRLIYNNIQIFFEYNEYVKTIEIENNIRKEYSWKNFEIEEKDLFDLICNISDVENNDNLHFEDSVKRTEEIINDIKIITLQLS